MKFLLVVVCLILMNGCTVTSNGKTTHYSANQVIKKVKSVVNGKQLIAKSNSKTISVLSWETLVIQELKEKNISDLSLYADSYLYYKSGRYYNKIKSNEFSYAKELTKAQNELEERVATSNAFGIYQITLPVELEKYDFKNKSFPVSHPDTVYTMSGRNIGNGLPDKIIVSFVNRSKIPGWDMPEKEAERFLNARSGRHIYVRYILDIQEYVGTSQFLAVVKEVHFINVGPNISTKGRKESLPPTKIVKL